MNSKDYELMFWVPIGILSIISFWMFPGNTNTNPSPTPILEYKLLEDTTIIDYNNNSRVLRYAVQEQLKDKKSYAPISTLQWAQLLSSDNDAAAAKLYIQSFINVLANAPMNAFFFETKGVSYSNSQNQPFEFVLVESPYLYQFADDKQDPDTFSGRFDECNKKSHQEEGKEKNNIGCVFSNPSGDSVLIAPLPIIDTTAATTINTNVYGHLAAFVRRAPKDQVIQFWKLVMQTYVERLKSEEEEEQQQQPDGTRLVWLSTDGTGVAWLHVRLDPRPKYYSYKPYVLD